MFLLTTEDTAEKEKEEIGGMEAFIDFVQEVFKAAGFFVFRTKTNLFTWRQAKQHRGWGGTLEREEKRQ